MSKKTKILILAFIALVGLFTNINTTSASSVTPYCNSATFNGSVTTNGNTTTVWFEWGTTASLGRETARQTFSHDADFNETITSLTENSTYYYRAMAQNSAGTATGDTISFRTSSCAGTTPNVTIDADDTNIDFDAGTIVRWDSDNATSCYGTNGANGWSNGLKTLSGSFYTGTLSGNRTFSITCSNNEGNTSSDSVTIYVSDQNSNIQPSVHISADDTNIDYEDSTRIRWDSDDADECDASGGANGWSGRHIGTSGSFNTGTLTSTKTYRIICTNNDSDETDTDSVTVHVNDNNNSSDRPSVTISADRLNISANEGATIRWDPNDADSCYASGGSNGWAGYKSTSGGSFYTGPLSFSTTYLINCSNDSGSDYDSITINVINTTQPTAPISMTPTVITTNALQIGNGNAQINSLVFTSNISTNAWFEWGTNASNLTSQTGIDGIGTATSVIHSSTISGLLPNTIYYYRAVAENSYGRGYGNVMNFIAEKTTPTPPTTIVRNVTTVVNNVGNTNSLVMLTIDGGADAIAPSESRIYHVEWKNITNQTLKKVVLRVILPQSMTFENTNKGSFTAEDNTITLDIGTLDPKDGGNMLFTANANTNLKIGELVVVVANLVYTDESSVQGDAVAYATHHGTTIVGGSVLGASAFGSGFLPTTFLGWLFLLILLLIVILLCKHLYNQFREPKQEIISH